MKSKGAIQFLFIAFLLVCIYQLSFTWVTRSVEEDAKIQSNGDPVKEQAYIDSISGEGVFDILLKDYTFKECKERELNLGLDLKGGMNVTLEVNVADVVRAMSNNSTDPTFTRALKKAAEMQKESGEDFVTLFGRAFNQIDPNAKLAAIYSTRELQERIKFTSTNEEVLAIIRVEAEDAIDRTFRILRARIDKFGVTQPNIQKLGTSGRILVELPGIKEPDRVRKILQGTAKLEFWETFENQEIYSSLDQANTKLRTLLKKTEPQKDSLSKFFSQSDTLAGSDTVKKPLASSDTLNQKPADTTGKSGSLFAQLGMEKPDTDTSLLSKLAGDTGDTAAKTFSEFTNENPLFAILRPALVQDEKGNYYPAEGPAIGFCHIKDTAKVNRYLGMAHVRNTFPKQFKALWTHKAYDENGNFLQLVAIKVTSRDNRAPLEGDVITEARQDFNQMDNSPEVTMIMNGEGAKTWKRMTGENIGKSVAIVLDDYVYSFPTVQGEIGGGRSSITGRFTIEEAKDLANVLKTGKLPARARVVEEAIVGPSLGKEAINAGMISFIIAFILVIIYMASYYNHAGMIADLALILNIFFILGVLASLGATLTLPGIAGIVLTLGMAVDANVLIYERVREEVRAGKGPRLALADGYKMAYSAIIDGNVTTLLIGIILYIFGKGPIQGFATTLIIGILTSLFAQIFITRLIFEWLVDRKKNIHFGNRLTENILVNAKFIWIAKRKTFYLLSSVVILAGIVSFVTNGFNLGVDFKGGWSYVVRFEKNVTTQEVRKVLAPVLAGAPEVKTFGSDNQVKITTKYLIDSDSANADKVVEDKLSEGLQTIAGNPFEIMSSQKVGPTVAADIRTGAVIAVTLSLIVMFLYILIRFRRWQFGMGATAALFHDVMITLSCYSLFYSIAPFSLEIDQAAIAALLTIVGYSINDTVIVFDRIREHLGMHRKYVLGNLMDGAINQTLARTINTAGTTLVTLISMFLLGGEVIRGFCFALIVGIAVGTYSSIGVASALAYETIKEKEVK